MHHKVDLEQLRESKNICEHPLYVKSPLAKLSEAHGKAREGATISFLTRKKKLLVLLVWVKSSLCFYIYPIQNLDYNGLRFCEVQ